MHDAKKRADYCTTCRAVKPTPPCETCEWGRPPAILPENEDAWCLWRAVQTQWRAAGFGIIGLDYGVVFEMGDRLGIEVTSAMIGKIQALEHAALEDFRDSKPENGGAS